MRLRMLSEDRYMPPSQTSFQFGDCGPGVLAIVKKAVRDGRRDFVVVEGMVNVDGEPGPVPHYWLEQGGKVYDPTKSQFGSQEVEYSPEGEYRMEYSPEEFLDYWEEQYGNVD